MPLSTKPIVVALNPLHPQALALASERFDLILPGSDRFDTWREHAQGVLTIAARVTEEDVETAKQYGKLRYVAKQGTGVDMLDLPALREAGIVVMNTPGINVKLALGLIIDAARKISTTHARFYAGETINKSEGWGGQTLFGKTLGLIDMQRWARGFPATDLTYVSGLDELLTRSDIVSLHCPLTKDTKDMISTPQFDLMKDSSILVNVARGGIVNERDLEIALKEGKISGAGVDVTVVEPPTRENYEGLCKAGCIITPHYGAAPAEVQEATCLAMVQHMIDALEHGIIRNRVV
ncbi:uncharacterized protein I303_101037 [Kwoniella dejecticola CBS 10117]|uniref:Phosphoglycerate dehydrogenase n=1 Tax=Kwoniella dejecticola CBS 10117 TaxID=1296121 RepID=A0AAJ8KHJ6_9TREE